MATDRRRSPAPPPATSPTTWHSSTSAAHAHRVRYLAIFVLIPILPSVVKLVSGEVVSVGLIRDKANQ